MLALPLSGFLNIDKPAGITSFEVVRRVRHAARTRKVGHAGTLDPLATGVLPIALGAATRLVDELVGATKSYAGTVRLGVETDTYDAEGSVTAEVDASRLDATQVAEALSAFVGEQEQVPPAYSAIKRDGVPAYRAARRGDDVVLEPRRIVVHALRLMALQPAGRAMDALIEVDCGKGFYVRSLAHDLGAALGEVGGHVTQLRRTRVGPFEARSAVPLDEAVGRLETEDADEVERLVHAPDVVLTSWPALVLGRESVAELRLGRVVRPAVSAVVRAGGEAERVRCYGPDGVLVGLARGGGAPGSWQPIRVFPHETVSQ